MIYFDHAATTYIDKEALDAYNDICLNNFGNPSGNYSIGFNAKAALDEARATVGRILNCDAEDVVFTSGGTESNNIMIQGYSKLNKGLHIIASAIEHKSVLKLLRFFKMNVTWVHPDKNGHINPKDVEDAITPETKLITCQLMNNEIGTLQNIKEISRIAKEHDIFMHTDAVQVVGHYPIDIKDLGVDALSASGHKFGAPKGTGILFTKHKKIGLIFGGSQEHKQRAGTENVAGAVALAKALENCDKHMKENMAKITETVNYLENELTKIPGVYLNVDNKDYHSIINFRIRGVENFKLVPYLDEHGICVSLGAACNSKTSKRSFVLKEIGMCDEDIDNSLRISLSQSNTKQECDEFVKVIKQAMIDLK